MASNVVLVVDDSFSMTRNGYVAITKRDGSAFVGYARPGDGLGVVAYSTNAAIAYKAGSSQLQVVDANLAANQGAEAAIQALTFNGNSTSINGGIVSARTLLDSAAAPKAMVLLTDGYQNDPPTFPMNVLPPYPIYTCAMGPDADISLLQTIASTTGGNAYVAPYPSTMMFIFNEIRALPQDVQGVANKRDSLTSTSTYQLIPAVISTNNHEAQFGVVWDDDSLSYTDGPDPSPSQISVTLVKPSGQISTQKPALVGRGYAVFNVQSPAVGTWNAQVISGAAVTVNLTTGAFEFPEDTANAVVLHLDAPLSVAVGEPIPIAARVTDHGEPVRDLTVRAAVTRPTVSAEAALREYGHLGEEHGSDASGHPFARLQAVRARLLPERDIMPHVSTLTRLVPTDDGGYAAAHERTDVAGGYNVHVTVSGHSAISDTPFERSRLVSVHVA